MSKELSSRDIYEVVDLPTQNSFGFEYCRSCVRCKSCGSYVEKFADPKSDAIRIIHATSCGHHKT